MIMVGGRGRRGRVRPPGAADISIQSAMYRRRASREYAPPVTIRNSSSWNSGGRNGIGSAGPRRRGINLIMLGAFALVAAGTGSVVSNADLPTIALMVVGAVTCLAGWRTLIIARRQEQEPRA